MADLKPCPFCGSDKLKIDSKSGRIHYYEKDGMNPWQNVVYSIRCNCCHARGGAVSSDLPTSGAIGIYENKREEVMNRAVKAWNTRKPMEVVEERLKHQVSQYDRRAEEHKDYADYHARYWAKKCSYEHALEIVRNCGKE